MFWKIFRSVLVLFAVALVIGIIWVSSLLKDYEEAQPKHAAEAVYNEYFKDFDAEKYADMCTESSAFSSKDDIVSYLNDITDGAEIQYMRVSSTDRDSYKYIVKAGETKFASFVLSEDTEASGKFTRYKAGDFELFTDSKSKISIEAPEGYKVLVNGTQLGSEHIKESGIEDESCKHMPEGVRGLHYDRYVINGLLGEPEVSVEAPDGTAAELSEEKGAYRALPVNDTGLQREHADHILEACEKYAVYMQYDSTVAVMGFNQIKGYFDPSSELYEDIRTVENMFVIEYTSYEFEDEKTGEFIRYDDDTFSCRVSFTHILHRRGDEDYRDKLDLTLYLRNVDGEYLIYDMSQN